MNYKVKSGSKSIKFEIDNQIDFSQEASIDLNRKTYRVRICETSPNGEIRSASINNKLYSVHVCRRPDGFPFQVTLNGTVYPVEVIQIQSTKYRPPTPQKKPERKVTASLSGQIRKVMIHPGDPVKKGQPLLVFEAMKMENEILAPRDGIVAAVNVHANQLVNKGEPLIDISD